MEIHNLNTRESLSGADFFAVDNGTDTAKVSYTDLAAAVLAGITGGATTVLNNDLTASRALVSNASGKISVASVTATELGRLSGVTGNIQTALDAKAPLASPSLTGTPTAPTAAAGTNTIQVATTAFVQTAVSGIAPTYSGMTANKPTGASNRVGSILGGYQIIGGVVYYCIRCTAAVALAASDYWTILEGFPTTPIEQAVPVAVVSKTGAESGYITTDGRMIISTSGGIAQGDNIVLCGLYYTA